MFLKILWNFLQENPFQTKLERPKNLQKQASSPKFYYENFMKFFRGGTLCNIYNKLITHHVSKEFITLL